MKESEIKLFAKIQRAINHTVNDARKFADGLHGESTTKIAANETAINDNISALADLGDASEGNADDANSALAELADMITALDERITALEAKGE